MELKRYKVIMCPKCKSIQTTEKKDTLKCRSCRKSTQFKSVKTGHLMVKIYNSFDLPKHATMLCKKLRKDKNKTQYLNMSK